MAHRGLSAPTYAYALNNPLSFVDQDGRSPQSRVRLIENFRFWTDFMSRHGLRRMPPLLNNFNASSPFRTELGCGAQADWMRKLLAAEGFEDYEFAIAAGRTSSSGVWPHQWIVATSRADNSVLSLDPWSDTVMESPSFEGANTVDWDLPFLPGKHTAGNYPGAMGGPWETVPTYGPWPSGASSPSWW